MPTQDTEVDALMKIAKKGAAKRIAKSTAKGLAAGLGLGGVGAAVGGAKGAQAAGFSTGRKAIDAHRKSMGELREKMDEAIPSSVRVPRILGSEKSRATLVGEYPIGHRHFEQGPFAKLNIRRPDLPGPPHGLHSPEDVAEYLHEAVPAGGLAAAALGAGAGLAKGIHGEMKRRKKSQPSK